MIAVAAVTCSAFADDAYVASSGGQAVNTGYRLKSNTRLEIDFQVDSVVAQRYIFGADGGSGTRCALWLNAGSNLEPELGGWCGSFIAGDTSRHVVVYDLPEKTVKLYAPGSDTPTHTKTTADRIADNGNAEYPIVLFATSTTNTAATVKLNGSCRIYSFKVYEKNGGGDYDLVHSWKPVVKGGEVGFIDSVGGSFIREHLLGSKTPLTIGGDYDTLDDDGYIESNGTTAISTGVLLDTDMRVEVDYALADITQPKARILGGYMGASFQTAEFYFQDSGSAMSFCVGKGWPTGRTILPSADRDTRRHTFVVDVPDGMVSFVTGSATNKMVATDGTRPVDGRNTFPLSLFGRTSANTNVSTNAPSYCSKARIYGARFYRSGMIVANFVPCVKGDVPGFRDTVSGVFHTGECNLEGLSAGGAVERIADDGFVETTDDPTCGHFIDTGYLPGANTRIEFDYALAANRTNTSTWYMLGADTGDTASPTNHFRLFQNIDSVVIGIGTNSWMNTGIPVQTNAFHVRRTAILDAANSSATILTAGWTNFSVKGSAPWVTANATRTLKIGSTAAGGSFAPVRIYGLKIYESGSLVREYVPFVQNGAPGLKYGDTFVKVSWSRGDAGMVSFPKAGGNVAVSSDRDRDAFALFTGAQSIDTGYRPNQGTKLVVDFSFANANNKIQQFVFEAKDAGGYCRLYTSDTGGNNAKYRYVFSKTWVTADVDSILCDHQRRLFMVDAPNNQVRFSPNASGGVYNGDSTLAGWTKPNCTSTLKIGSDYDGSNNFAKIRLYRFTIYDNGEMVRDFVPYVANGVPGLYDTVGGELFTAEGLTVSGRGYDGHEEWVDVLDNVRITKFEGSKTISAAAVGAQSYKWTKNGVAISGGSDGNLVVEWAKGGATDTYTVTPVYSVFGCDVEGEPAPVTVKNMPLGMVITFM